MRETTHVGEWNGRHFAVGAGRNLEHPSVRLAVSLHRSDDRFLACQPAAPRCRPARAVDSRAAQTNPVAQQLAIGQDLERGGSATRERIVRARSERRRWAVAILMVADES